MAITLCVVGSAVLMLFGDGFIRFFIDDARTIRAGVDILHVFVWDLPFVGAQVTLMVSFQALGKPLQATVVTMGRQLLFFVPLLYLLNRLFGFDGFIWAQPAADILTTGIAAVIGLSPAKLMRGDK
jgi:Na+-driven multidrug efflux pump